MSTGDLAADRRTRLAASRLYLVCDARPSGRELTDVLSAAIRGGVDVVQLREKRMDDAALTAVVRGAVELCARLEARVLLIVNDRPAVALATGADGVHVGQDDMPVAEVRALVGEDLLIGLSTHASAEIDAAMVGGSPSGGDRLVDYIGVGPIHATPTKPGRPAVGLELVRYAVAHAPKPFFAIGGIEQANVGAVLDAGATRVAVVRAIAAAADPEAAARGLREALDARTPSRERRVEHPLPEGSVSEPSRGELRDAEARAAAQAAAPKPSGGDRAQPGQRDVEARAALEPLGAGEWPRALVAAIAVALLLAVAVMVGAASVHELNRHGGSLGGAIFLAAVLVALASGMYRHRYWAVLGFEALLAFQVIVTSLALVVASTVTAAVVCVVSIVLGGWLFWKLVRVMGRIQAGERQ
jgi:thiamine-phosphate pyrophosphorylase